MLFNILHNTEYLIQRGVPEQATTPHVLHKLGDWSVALQRVIRLTFHTVSALAPQHDND